MDFNDRTLVDDAIDHMPTPSFSYDTYQLSESEDVLTRHTHAYER